MIYSVTNSLLRLTNLKTNIIIVAALVFAVLGIAIFTIKLSRR